MRLTIATLAFAAAVAPVMAFAAGNAVDGQRDFARCARCHAVQPGTNGIGPSLSGVVGRQSGSEPGFHYSTDQLFEKAVLANSRRLIAIARSIVGNRASPEDVVQLRCFQRGRIEDRMRSKNAAVRQFVGAVCRFNQQ